MAQQSEIMMHSQCESGVNPILYRSRYAYPHDKMERPLSSGDIPSVLGILSGAISNDAATQKHAEGLLSELEQRQGFCSCLVVRLASWTSGFKF